jgi:hypothetical protein
VRALSIVFLASLAVVGVAAAVHAAGLLWYSTVEPPISANLSQVSGTLVRVSGECPNVKGGSAFVVHIRAESELAFSERCGRKLRDQLHGAVGAEVVAQYRLERDLVFWSHPRLYALRSRTEVFREPRAGGGISPWATGVLLLAVAVSITGAVYALRAIKRLTRLQPSDA